MIFNEKDLDNYISPADHSELKLDHNVLIDKSGNTYSIIKDVPDLTYPKQLKNSDQYAKDTYNNVANVYDKYIPLTFKTFDSNENEERYKMIQMLNLQKDSCVLEMGAGTGRTSELMLKYLGTGSKLFLQDISYQMIYMANKKFQSINNKNTSMHFSVSNANYLPYKAHFFDAIYHFGGLNTFSNLRRTFQEIVRIAKKGARVVVGDENMPIWLRNTEFGKILMNSNHHYQYPLPIEFLPVEARDVSVHWIIGGVFYVIAFTVGEGEPKADFDFEIPGKRGGTHRTRYYGQLEGVTLETKKLVQQVVERSKDVSMHKWVDKILKEAAEKKLKSNK